MGFFLNKLLLIINKLFILKATFYVHKFCKSLPSLLPFPSEIHMKVSSCYLDADNLWKTFDNLTKNFLRTFVFFTNQLWSVILFTCTLSAVT